MLRGKAPITRMAKERAIQASASLLQKYSSFKGLREMGFLQGRAFCSSTGTPSPYHRAQPQQQQQQRQQASQSTSIQLHKFLRIGIWTSLSHPRPKVFPTQALQLSSAASPVSEKDGNSDASVEETCISGDEKVEPMSEGKDESVPEIDKEQAAKAEQEDKEALLNSIAQLEALLSEKNSQLLELKERAVTTKAELENVRTRAQREADNTKKYAVQEFAKSLLDVADNLGRALMTIPANVRKELLTDQSETGKLLKSVVEGLIMTERELMKVLKKFGVEKFEPVGQQFDPNSHLALFEMADPSKEPGTVALVAKVGYMLHDRVLRPAEVGVVKSLE